MKPGSVMLPLGPEPTLGTPVWGSAFNAASALFYRFCGLLEAPPEVDQRALQAGLFVPEVELRAPGVSLNRVQDLLAFVDRQRASARRSHHLDHGDIGLSWIGPGVYRLDANYTSQSLGDGGLRTERTACRATLAEQPDGSLRFADLEVTPIRNEDRATFEPSYIENRARALIVEFQSHMDALSGEGARVHHLLEPKLELHGLVASRKDETNAGRETFRDVDDLRRSIAGVENTPDNVIRDRAGFSAWFATCLDLFNYGLHRLEAFSVAPLPDRRFSLVAQFDWQAETRNGARIELHQPLTWITVDRDEAFMRIEKLLPFGSGVKA